MDFTYYDVEGASERIEQLSADKLLEEQSRWEVDDGIHLASSDAVKLFHPVQTGISSCHRLLYKNDFLKRNGVSVTGNVEVVGHLHGIVSYAHLESPTQPFLCNERIPERILTVTGLKSRAFELAVSTIRSIDQLFAKTSPGHRWIPWKPGSAREFSSVRFATRVLTPTHQCRQTKGLEKIPDGHDETRVLQSLVNEGQFKFLDENEVKVYRYAAEEGEKIRKGHLSDVRQGELVHCQVSFCAVKTRDGDHLMKLILRSVLIEDTKFSEVAKEKERHARQKKRSVTEAGVEGTIHSFVGFKIGKKRKLFQPEEEERTRKRLGAVAIKDGTTD